MVVSLESFVPFKTPLDPLTSFKLAIMPPKTKKRRLEKDTSKNTKPSLRLSEPSKNTTTTVKPPSGKQHEGDATPPETSTLDSQNTFQTDLNKHEEDTGTTLKSETNSATVVKESMVNLEKRRKNEQNEDQEQQSPSEDDDSDEEYTGDCFDGWEKAWGSDASQSLHGGSSDEDIVFSTSNGTLSRRELRKIEEAAERFPS
jgi:hypothetical protein